MSVEQSVPAYRVRPASRHDLEVLGDLWLELMTFHTHIDTRFAVSPQGRNHYIRHLHQALRDQNYQVLVADASGEVVGYILGYIAQNPPIFPRPTYGFIADICVKSGARQRGVGRLLVTDLCRWFRQRGMGHVQLNVAHANGVSQAFWRKMGCTDYLDHMWFPLAE